MQYIDRAGYPSQSRQANITLCVGLAMLIFVFCPSSGSAQPAPNGKAKAKPVDKKPQQNDFKQPDPVLLPPGFQPPPEPLVIMDLEQPIATKDELAKLKQAVGGKLSKALRDCDLSSAGKQIIESGIRYKLAEMTLRENRKELPELHKKLMRDLTTNIGGPGLKPTEIAAMTQFASQEVIKQIPELLVNNFYVRLHAVLILSELDYAPAYALLLQVIQAKDIKVDPIKGQPEAVKIAAMQGLIRILKFAVPPPAVVQRTAIAHAIIEELQRPDTHWWYQVRLIEGLRHMTVSVDAGNNKPFVIDALLAVISDSKREWVVRSKACYAVGRVPIPAAVKPEDVVTAIADYGLQLSKAKQANPPNPIWKGCFWDLYLAFKSDGLKDKDGKDKDQDAERRVVGGLLARFKPVAQAAYDQIVPIVRDVLHGKDPSAEDVKNLGDFVSQRMPNKPEPKPNAPAPDGKPQPQVPGGQ